MKKDKKLISLYNDICSGKINFRMGLCYMIKTYSTEYLDEFIDLFSPTNEEKKLIDESGLCRAYWGCDSASNDEIYFQFSQTRQNMLLLMAAIHDEL